MVLYQPLRSYVTFHITVINCSVIGSLSVLVVSIVRWRHLKGQVHLLAQLALADLLAALILMSTSAMNFYTSVMNTDKSVTICQYSLPLSLTFYFVSFLLVVVYAWKSKNAIQGWRTSPTENESGQSHCRRKIITVPVYALVWLIPIALYLAYVLTPFIKPATNRSMVEIISNDTQYCGSCILFLHVWTEPCKEIEQLHDTFLKVFLFLVVIPVMLSCSVIYYKVGKWYERHQQEGLFPVEGDGRSRKRFKGVFSTARSMVIVILICWTPALVLILLFPLMTSNNVKQSSLFGIYILQAVGVSLQGFLNSMVYAWRRPNFTEAVLGEHTPLMAYGRLAFFDESLRSRS
uniref:G-protein coupled receptors family 1 profile domain-containing protein n=1 Tax=Monopterus albus TaxID=43700 RepID=A0A3Q3IWR6_MONAL